ncbi:MAG TPA: hypothetical protein VGG64_26465 [Pirellulales bacterium]|jgi:hypothetical protein
MDTRLGQHHLPAAGPSHHLVLNGEQALQEFRLGEHSVRTPQVPRVTVVRLDLAG